MAITLTAWGTREATGSATVVISSQSLGFPGPSEDLVGPGAAAKRCPPIQPETSGPGWAAPRPLWASLGGAAPTPTTPEDWHMLQKLWLADLEPRDERSTASAAAGR